MIIFIAMCMVIFSFTTMSVAVWADEYCDRKEARKLDLNRSISLAETEILGR